MQSNNVLVKIGSFLNEVKVEMKKVEWLTTKQTINSTIVVLAISLVVATFLGGLDYIFSQLLNLFI